MEAWAWVTCWLRCCSRKKRRSNLNYNMLLFCFQEERFRYHFNKVTWTTFIYKFIFLLSQTIPLYPIGQKQRKSKAFSSFRSIPALFVSSKQVPLLRHGWVEQGLFMTSSVEVKKEAAMIIKLTSISLIKLYTDNEDAADYPMEIYCVQVDPSLLKSGPITTKLVSVIYKFRLNTTHLLTLTVFSCVTLGANTFELWMICEYHALQKWTIIVCGIYTCSSISARVWCTCTFGFCKN